MFFFITLYVAILIETCRSSHVAEKLAQDLNGRIKVEDAGFDWKILGPDVDNFDYVSWTCDQVGVVFDFCSCIKRLNGFCRMHMHVLDRNVRLNPFFSCTRTGWMQESKPN